MNTCIGVRHCNTTIAHLHCPGSWPLALAQHVTKSDHNVRPGHARVHTRDWRKLLCDSKVHSTMLMTSYFIYLSFTLSLLHPLPLICLCYDGLVQPSATVGVHAPQKISRNPAMTMMTTTPAMDENQQSNRACINCSLGRSLFYYDVSEWSLWRDSAHKQHHMWLRD